MQNQPPPWITSFTNFWQRICAPKRIIFALILMASFPVLSVAESVTIPFPSLSAKIFFIPLLLLHKTTALPEEDFCVLLHLKCLWLLLSVWHECLNKGVPFPIIRDPFLTENQPGATLVTLSQLAIILHFLQNYSWEHKNRSKVLHTCVVNEFLKACFSYLFKYFRRSLHNDLEPITVEKAHFWYLLGQNWQFFNQKLPYIYYVDQRIEYPFSILWATSSTRSKKFSGSWNVFDRIDDLALWAKFYSIRYQKCFQFFVTPWSKL